MPLPEQVIVGPDGKTPSRPRVLTIWLTSWYGSGRGTSAEETLWGGGLLGRLGFDQHHIRMEHVGHAELERIIRAYAPYEFVVFAPYTEVPHWLRPMIDPGTPIVVMMSDDDWRFDNFSRHFIHVADYIWTPCESVVEKYHALGFDNVILSNWACRPEWALPDPIEVPQRGASFCGWLYGDRLARLKEIGEAGDITVMAHNWQEKLLSPEEYQRFTASWAFALCLTKSSHGVRQMKGRMFEPQVHGSVLVTEPMTGLDKWWVPDEECVVFETPQEAQDKMAWLLADPKRFLTMSERAYRRVLREHTWYHRFRQIIERMGKRPPAWPSVLLQEEDALARLDALKKTRRVGTIPIEAIDKFPGVE